MKAKTSSHIKNKLKKFMKLYFQIKWLLEKWFAQFPSSPVFFPTPCPVFSSFTSFSKQTFMQKSCYLYNDFAFVRVFGIFIGWRARSKTGQIP